MSGLHRDRANQGRHILCGLNCLPHLHPCRHHTRATGQTIARPRAAWQQKMVVNFIPKQRRNLLLYAQYRCNAKDDYAHTRHPDPSTLSHHPADWSGRNGRSLKRRLIEMKQTQREPHNSLFWEDHQIDFQCYYLPKYLWLAAETIVFVDGQEVARSGGFHLKESATGTFKHNETACTLELQLRSDFLAFRSVRYVLLINNQKVSEDRVYIQNWSAPAFNVTLIVLLYFFVRFYIL